MQKLKITLLFFLLCVLMSAQLPEHYELIEWNEFYKVTWSDFKGKPSAASIGDAGTVVQIKAKPYLVRKEIRYDVYAFFNRTKSWYRDKSEALLAHEQLHFDIAELYARKIRKKVRELHAKGVNDMSIYNTAIRKLLDESNEIDMQYDAETLHGSMVRKQQDWTQRVARELSELVAYKKRKTVFSGE